VPARDKVFCFGSFGFRFSTVATLVVAPPAPPPKTISKPSETHPKTTEKPNQLPRPEADNMYVSLFMVNWVIYVAADKLCFSAPVLVRLSWHLNCQAAQVLDCGIGPVNGPLFALAGLRARTRTNSTATIATKDANVAGSQQFVLELR